MTLMSRVSCNGRCCGIQRLPASTLTWILTIFFLRRIGHQRILHPTIPEKTYAKNFLLEGTRFDDEELVVAMGLEGDDWMKT